MGKTKVAKVKIDDLWKIDNMFKLKMPRTKNFSIITNSMPRIINEEIIKRPSSKKRIRRITYLQEFEI